MIPFELKKNLEPTDRYSMLTEDELVDFYKNRVLLFSMEYLGGNIYKLHDKFVVQYNHNSNIFEFFDYSIREAIKDLYTIAKFYNKGKITEKDFNELEKLATMGVV